ncbi:MAG TPA: SRPBCC family protein [Bryobacteraceae bacterium]
MASIRKEISTKANVNEVWAALRDVGALHTRLVPGFVVDTRLEPGARIVTFGNGTVLRELIVDVSDETKRVVWSARRKQLTHHNASLQAFEGEDGQTRVVWIADVLPNEAAGAMGQLIEQGMSVMRKTLDALAEKDQQNRAALPAPLPPRGQLRKVATWAAQLAGGAGLMMLFSTIRGEGWKGPAARFTRRKFWHVGGRARRSRGFKSWHSTAVADPAGGAEKGST